MSGLSVFRGEDRRDRRPDAPGNRFAAEIEDQDAVIISRSCLFARISEDEARTGNASRTIFCFRAVLAAGLGLLAAPAPAENATTIFGHEIRVSDGVPEDRLMIDGTTALQDGQIFLWEIGLADDAPFVLGWTGSGGSLCASVPFVISFFGEVRAVDLLPIECVRLPHVVGEREILFESPGDSSCEGLAYLWTPRDGFTRVDASVVDSGSGWDAMRRREITAPRGFLDYPDTRDRLRELAGDAMPDLVRLISGPSELCLPGNAADLLQLRLRELSLWRHDGHRGHGEPRDLPGLGDPGQRAGPGSSAERGLARRPAQDAGNLAVAMVI